MKVREAAAFFRKLELARLGAASRPHDARTGAGAAGLSGSRSGWAISRSTARCARSAAARPGALRSTSALGSSLVNMLYVLDEPSIGLHPRDINQLLGAIRQLRDRSNTVVVVEHEEAIIRAADQVIEIGPGAGERGGKVVFQGTPGRNGAVARQPHRRLSRRPARFRHRRPAAAAPNHGWIRLAGARGNNLKNVTVEFPLGVLCLVTGVSGSGKSTLVQDTLYPALCRRLRKDAPKPYRLRRRLRRRPDRRRDHGRSKPDRPLAALATR